MAKAPWRTSGTLFGLFLLSVGFAAYLFAPAAVLPLMMEAFGIGKPAASASISAVFLTWALFQIPAGLVMDRYDNRTLVILGGIVFLAAAVGGLRVGTYPGFLLTRLASETAAVFIWIGSVNVLREILPETREALGISILITSPPLGVATAQFTGPVIAGEHGWESAILAYTALAGFGLLLFAAGHREPVTAPERITLSQFAAAIRNPQVVTVSLASLCTYAVFSFLNTWMPTYGAEIIGIELRSAGAAAALVPLAAIVARPGGGWLADRLGGRLRPILLASFLASAGFLYGLSGASSPRAFAALLAVTGAAVNVSVGLYYVYVGRLTDPRTHGTSLSVLAALSIVGNLIAPYAGGIVIERVSWTAGFLFAIGLAVAGFAALLLSPRAS